MKPENMTPEQRGMAFEEYIDVSSFAVWVSFIANCMPRDCTSSPI